MSKKPKKQKQTEVCKVVSLLDKKQKDFINWVLQNSKSF